MTDWINLPTFERMVHVALHADRIFVRAQIDGKWESVALSELPDDLKFSETRRLVLRDVPPVMVIGDGDAE